MSGATSRTARGRIVPCPSFEDECCSDRPFISSAVRWMTMIATDAVISYPLETQAH